MITDTKEEVIEKLNKKIEKLEKDKIRWDNEPKVIGQYEMALSNLYRALATLYTS